MSLLEVTPNQDAIQTVLRSFLLDILGDDIEVIEGQDNRVPEPKGTEFVVMTPIRRPRLSTNVRTAADVKFTGSIAATVMTVTEMFAGEIRDGATVFGVGVTANTKVVEQLTGTPGQDGTYTITPSQTVASKTLSAGSADITQSNEVVFQLNVHAADVADASDRAQVISTMLRDPYAASFFEALEPEVSPLYAEDPRQIPFMNAEQQYETRWVVEAVLQANQTVLVPQQYADSIEVELVSVEAVYPPA